MDMLDDSGNTHHVSPESYSFLSDIERSAVERMSSTVGNDAILALLSNLDRDALHSTIAKFIQHELDEMKEKVALLNQQGSQQAELLRLQQVQTPVPGMTQTRRPETLKIDISKYRGVEEDSLLRWFVELDDAIRARHIVDEQMQVAFAQSNLAGRAKTWALGLKLRDPYVFGSLEVFKTRLKQTFEPPRAEFRARSELLKLKQGKRDVHAYAQHIRLLASCITNNPVHEHTLITVFMQGLTDGPVKTHLFRLELDTLEEAISVAEQEDFSLRQAQASSSSYRPPRRHELGGPEPMDLSYVESERPRFSNNKRSQKCHRCQKLGHYAHECSAPRPAPKGTERNFGPYAKKGNGRGSDVVAKSQQRGGPPKNGRGQ